MVALATHKIAPLFVHSDVVPVGQIVPLSPIQPTMEFGWIVLWAGIESRLW